MHIDPVEDFCYREKLQQQQQKDQKRDSQPE